MVCQIEGKELKERDELAQCRIVWRARGWSEKKPDGEGGCGLSDRRKELKKTRRTSSVSHRIEGERLAKGEA